MFTSEYAPADGDASAAAGGPGWSQTVAFQNLSTAAQIMFMVVCTGVPVGSQVALACAQPGPEPPVDIGG